MNISKIGLNLIKTKEVRKMGKIKKVTKGQFKKFMKTVRNELDKETEKTIKKTLEESK